MASANCCINRDPPSPDGESPRPAKSPTTPSKKLSKDPILCSSAVSRFSKPEDAAALQAIFEDKSDMDHDMKIIPKKSSSTLNAVKSKLQKHLSRESVPIFEEDKTDESDIDSELQTATKKTPSNLSVVKSKLRKHISRDSGLSKHRSAVGSSEEELDRRAELRRIRHKRIQEELGNEEAYDDDAKSIISDGGTCRVSTPLLLSLKHNTSMKFEGHDLFPDYEKQHLTLMEARGYQIASEMGSKVSKPRRLSDVQIEPDNTLVRSNTTRSRRHSLPGTSDEAEALQLLKIYEATRKRSYIPPLPPKPLLEPKRLPSIADSTMTKSSWRLSFASDDRATHLRKLSQGHTLPIIETGDPRAVSPPPLSKWLQSQGLRESSQVVTYSEDEIHAEPQIVPSRTSQLTQDFGGVDGPSEELKPAHLHEMGISQLLSRGQNSSSSSPQLSIWHRRGLSSISAVSRLTHNSRTRFMREDADSAPLSDIIPPSWGKILRPKASSSYPSEGIRDSPQSSRFNLLALLAGSKSKEELENIKDDEDTLLVPPNTATTSFDTLPTPALDIPLAISPRRLSVDNPSVVVSETRGFQDGEVEFHVIKSRVKVSGSSRDATTPVSSKFREEFEEPDSGRKLPRKNFILAAFQFPQLPNFTKLTKRAHTSYDGANSHLSVDNNRDGVESSIPTPRIGFGFMFPNSSELIDATQGTLNIDDPANTDSSGMDPFNSLPDSAQNAWRRAVKMHGKAKAQEIITEMKLPKPRSKTSSIGLKSISLKLPRKRKSDRVATKNESYTEGEDEILMRTESIKVEVTQEILNEPREISDQKAMVRQRTGRHQRVINAWENEMKAVERGAKDKSKDILPRGRSLNRSMSTGILPPSWCRYPSHTRDERTKSAGLRDHVISHDFAIKSAHSPSHDTQYYSSDRKHHHPYKAGKDYDQAAIFKAETLPAKFRRSIRNSIYRIRAAGEGNERGGTKSVINPGGSLEYPELEILPSLELAGLEGLEMEIVQAVRANERERRRQRVVGGGDGSVDGNEGGDEKEVELDEGIDGDSKVSIADPGFYGDCVPGDEIANNEGDLERRIRQSLDRINGGSVEAGKVELVGLQSEGHILETLEQRNRKAFVLLRKYFTDQRSTTSGYVGSVADADMKELVEGGDLKNFIQTDFEKMLAARVEEHSLIGKECGVKDKDTSAEDEETIRKNKKTTGSREYQGTQPESRMESFDGVGFGGGGVEENRERKVSLGTMALKEGSGSNVYFIDGGKRMEEERTVSNGAWSLD